MNSPSGNAFSHGPGRRATEIELPGLSADDWSAVLAPVVDEVGEPRYRLAMLMDWVFRRGADDFHSMSNLPKRLRQALDEHAVLHPLGLLEEQRSSDGTRKFLWSRRGEPIESVLIPDGKRRTFCISTQAGCPVKCTFCATGHGGFSGQLTAGEIVDQVLQLTRQAEAPPTNLVFMGMGEPLLNAPNVFKAIEILGHPDQVGIGCRRITVSTVGVPKRIVELAERYPQVKLAVSLHAPRDELRDRIIPLNRQYPLDELLAACRRHHEISGKKVTFEYVVLPGVNDRLDDAKDLGTITREIPSRINLIGFNPFPGAAYAKPRVPDLLRFRDRVTRFYQGPVTVRRSRGEDIQGACGQLSLANAAAGSSAPDSRR